MSMTSKTKHWTGVNRLSDWPERLMDCIESKRDAIFQWGSFDCSQFCIAAEQAMYGTTRWPEFLNTYKSKRGSMRLVRKLGASGIWDLVDQRMKRLSSVKMTQRGDWIGHYTQDGESLGIYVGNRFVCVHKEQGLVFHPMTEAVVAWRG